MRNGGVWQVVGCDGRVCGIRGRQRGRAAVFAVADDAAAAAAVAMAVAVAVVAVTVAKRVGR